MNRFQSDLNRQANFSSFGAALLTLLRVVTGDDWSSLMFNAMVQQPHCSETNVGRDRGCGNQAAAYTFFIRWAPSRPAPAQRPAPAGACPA